MNKAIIIILLILFSTEGWTQKVEEITHREINVHFNDSSIKANVLLTEKKPHLNNSIDYYWYHNNAIKRNQGDYKGRLLDGDYQVSTKRGNLIAKGNFKKGSKSGVWKRWSKDGQLIISTNWFKGFKNGKYQKYDEGQLVEKGVYKKGQLNGKQIKFQSDSVFSITKYVKGKEVVKKKKKKKEREPSVKSEGENKKLPFWKINREKAENSKDDKDSVKNKKQKLKKEKKAREKKLPKEKKKLEAKSKNED